MTKIKISQVVLSFLYLLHSIQLFLLASYYEKPNFVPFYEDPSPAYRYGAVLSFSSFLLLLFIHRLKALAVIPLLRSAHGLIIGLFFNTTTLAVFFIDITNPDKIFTKNTFLEFLHVWPLALFVVTIVHLIFFMRKVESTTGSVQGG